MDSSSSAAPPVPLDVRSSRSTPHFPLLDGRIDMFLKQILQKMNPVVLTTVRQGSSYLNRLLMEEERKRTFVAHTTFEEFMRPDVRDTHTTAEMFFYDDRVQIVRRPAPFSSTSLLFHQPHSDCSCSRQSYEFWKNHIRTISAATAMSHLAGSEIPYAWAWDISDAAALISLVRPYNIRVEWLGLRRCVARPEAAPQMLHHFQPTKLSVYVRVSLDDFQKSEQIAVDQIDADKVIAIDFDSTQDDYPGRLFEHFWSRFQQSPTFLRRLTTTAPFASFPLRGDLLPSGMDWCFLTPDSNLSNPVFLPGFHRVVLLRTKSRPARHILLTARFHNIMDYRLVLQCVSNADELLSSFDPRIARFSPSQIRHIFNSPNWGPFRR